MEQVIFNSITEIPSWINAHPVAGMHNSSESWSKDLSWDDRLGFTGAMDMAEKGGYWAEGARKMIEATTDMDQLKHDGFVKELDYDVSGPILDMDEYLSGSPECFINEDEVPSPVIKIGVQQYTPGSNDMKEFVYRGAAILSAIDELEAKGVRCELWGCVSGIYRGDREHGIDMRTCLKAAEETWSPSSVAFGLAHPAFSRRLGFRVAESFESLQTCGYLNGHSLDFKNDRPIDSDFDVWFGYNDMVVNTYTSVEYALKRINAEIEAQLKEKL